MENIEEGISSVGVTVVKSDVHPDNHVAHRTEFSNSVAVKLSPATSQAVFSPAVTTFPVKKKRGRPRKYGPDAVLSPKPISSSVPSPVIDFSVEKRVKVRPIGFSSKQQHKTKLENSGEWVACSVGANFTPHIITVNSGEDVTMKIISFSQLGPRAICVLSANGVISSVTLRQPDSSGGTLTYEGRFEILSLSGSFMLSDSGGTRSRSGGMSVSLAGPDGRVLGGGVAGLLVAASPVQIVIGSFLMVSKHEQKQQKKDKTEFISMARPTLAVPISSVQMEDPYGNNQGQHNSTPKNWSLTSSDSRNEPADINATVSGC